MENENFWVLDENFKSVGKNMYSLIRCNHCYEITTKRKSNLKTTEHCGCRRGYRKERLVVHNKEQDNKNITVLIHNFEVKENGHYLHKVKCNHCDMVFTTQDYSTLQSCGCRSGVKNRKGAEEAAFSKQIRSYKNGAKSRKIKWELSDKEALFLMKKNCYYCNKEPYESKAYYTAARKRSISRGSYFDEEYYRGGIIKVMGIDRKDSTKDYTKNNTVPCCTTCNIIKREISYEDFLSTVEAIYNHRIKKE